MNINIHMLKYQNLEHFPSAYHTDQQTSEVTIEVLIDLNYSNFSNILSKPVQKSLLQQTKMLKMLIFQHFSY